MANFFLGAALKAAGDGGEAWADATLAERKNAEAAAMRREELDARYGDGGGGRSSGGGGVGSRSGGQPGFDLERAKKLEGYLSPAQLEKDVPQAEAVTTNLYSEESGITNDDEGNSGTVSYVPPAAKALREDKKDELRRIREIIGLGGKDAESLADIRAKDQQRGFLGEYARGNDRSGQAATIGNKDAVYSDNAYTTTNRVTGESKPTAVGLAEAGKDGKQGEAAVIKANQPRAGGGGGGGGRVVDPATMTLKQIESERKRFKDEIASSLKGLEVSTGATPEIKARNKAAAQARYEQALADNAEFQARLRRTAPEANEPASAAPTSGKMTALPEGARYIGMSKTGKKVYQLPNGQKMAQE